eukprot:SAG11_NODE_1672_length_4483_cov_3.470119_2_plen_113_part_00
MHLGIETFSPESGGLALSGAEWAELKLFDRGAALMDNCVRVPRTCSIIRDHVPRHFSPRRHQVVVDAARRVGGPPLRSDQRKASDAPPYTSSRYVRDTNLPSFITHCFNRLR